MRTLSHENHSNSSKTLFIKPISVPWNHVFKRTFGFRNLEQKVKKLYPEARNSSLKGYKLKAFNTEKDSNLQLPLFSKC